MKKGFGVLCVLSALSLFYACSDPEKKLANGYTEEQNAGRTEYDVVLETWEPAVAVDSTQRTWKGEDGLVVTWYEVDFTSAEDVYYEKSVPDEGAVAVSVFKEENGIRLTVNNAAKESNFTVTLNRDSTQAVTVDRLDNEYLDESADALCAEDSLRFVNECYSDSGFVANVSGNKACNPLHLMCTKTFAPTKPAEEYIAELAEKLVAQGESELKNLPKEDSVANEDTVLVDERDGQVYKIVKIGDQTWMAENLNYAYLQPTTLWDSTSFCYQNDPANCEIYGRLYSWSAAMDSAGLFSDDAKGCGFGVVCLPPRNVQGVCPEGWRIPNYDEWNTLFESVDPGNNGGLVGIKLKVAEDGGTDDYGFGLRIAGRHIEFDTSENSYSQLGDQTVYQATEESDSASAFGVTFFGKFDYVGRTTPFSKYIAYPVRCIKGKASEYPAGAVDPATAVTGTFTDTRDNREYKTTTIGKITWMAENLDYNDEGSVCYEGDDANCATYGRLYTWEAAGSVCPSGWRLPSKADYDSLKVSVGVSYAPIKATSGWSASLGNGTDVYGFSLLPNGSGRVSGDTIAYSDAGAKASLWTASESTFGDSYSYIFNVEWTSSGQFDGTLLAWGNYSGVRCVKE